MKKYQGLTEEAAAASRREHGTNRLEGREKKSFLKRLLSNFSDPIVRVLLAALAINILFTLKNMNLLECVGIVIAIALSTLVSTISEYGSENAFEKLLEKSDKHVARVYRDGELKELPIDDLAVGDIVLLGAGEGVPADGILLEGDLSVDQSALNGESREAKKRPGNRTTPRTPDAGNRLFRGSLVTHGSAVMEVTEVGAKSFLGGVAAGLTADTRESPLKLRLSALAKVISRIGYLLAALVAFSYLFGKIVVDNNFDKALILSSFSDLKGLLSLSIRALTLAITVVVVAVPEGLPMMICVVLSSNMKKMLNDQILVKKLVGIETAGSLNLLFCDKTGTITTGVQSVEGVVLGNGKWISDPRRLSREAVYPLLVSNAVYNTDCSVISKKAVGSNATDRAIVDYFCADTPPLGAIYGGIPFSSRYKYSAAALPDGRVLIKGAPEILLPQVRHALDEEGRKAAFSRDRVMAEYKRLTARSSRLLAVVLSDRMPSALGFSEMTFVALIAIKDRLRESARRSVETLQEAGIGVVMVTGDSPDTARAIALEAGILHAEKDAVVTSGELAGMSDAEVAALLPRLAVVARALPQDKTRLVRVAQEQELVVGMTGDGVNDAPALKLSDVGFAMGSGTDIAKEAGDIVILDNDISAIVKAVLYGRTIFKSIRKFIVFQLTMNLCAVGVTLIGPLFGMETPITIIQMLWVNIIMDTLGGLAFAGEAATADTMTEPPKKRNESLLSAEMLGKILWNGLMTILISIGFMAFAPFKEILGFSENPLCYYSAFFSLFIFLGVMNFFNARTERINLLANLSKNKSFILITLLITTVQLLMVYFGGTLFRTAPLSPRILAGVAALSFVVIPLDTIRRVIMRLGMAEKKTKASPEKDIVREQKGV